MKRRIAAALQSQLKVCTNMESQYLKNIRICVELWKKKYQILIEQCLYILIIYNNMQIKQDRIGVFVRIRPYQQKEQNTTFIVNHTDRDITVKDKDREKEQELRFSFDKIFPAKTEQHQLFETIGQPIVDSAFEGINGTIFAYGQTSSGKTFTCVGPDCQDVNLKGLLPRCVSGIFERISSSPNYLEFRIKVSMVQIYMQRIKDLLDPSKTDLKLRENKARGIYIQDVTEEYVSSPQETMKIFRKGVGNRAVASTNMNEQSSRSHMAFILTLHQNNLKDGSARSGKITVVDLAGSQKVSKTQAQGRVLDQAKQINKSLSSLGNVITALTDSKISHIPYRDSKLTRLLQESLGGNSKTNLIINISPSGYNASESVSSLRFGFRAKEIKNKPKINKEYTIPQLLILLEKSEKRNQELELLLKELTASSSKKIKKKQGGFIENLLDSDNPIMSAISDNEGEVGVSPRKSVIKTIRKYYESEIGSEGEDQKEKIKDSNINIVKDETHNKQIEEKLKEIIAQKDEELSILGEELQRINSERVDMIRELDICRQRLQCTIKEARVNAMKFNSEKKESQNLLQKYIKENLQNQEKEETISNLHSKIVVFEERFIKLSQIHAETVKQSNVFGVSKSLNEQTQRILKEALQEEEQDPVLKKEVMESMQKDKKIKQLSARVKHLQSEVCTFQHLQETKQDFIKQKIKFIGERDRIYKDLQNRIQKVLQLQEMLDEAKQRKNYLEDLISMQQSDKIRKIQSLERHISSISEQYYVLKGQQSSWKRNNDRLQKKINELTKKLLSVQSQNFELRIDNQNSRIRCLQLEAMAENQSVLDMDLSEQDNQEGGKTGNIVKVMRSSILEYD